MAFEVVSLHPVRAFVAKATEVVAYIVVSGVALALTLRRIDRLALVPIVLAAILLALSIFKTWCALHELLRSRTAWRCLSLLAHPLPNGWRGPFLIGVDHPHPFVVYGIPHEEDGARIPGQLVYVARLGLRRDDDTLTAFVIGSDPAERIPDARCRALLRQLLEVDWAAVGQRPSCGTLFECRPGSGHSPFALDDAIDRSRPPRWPRLTRAIEVPASIAFPREPFAAELARHEALVRAHLDGLAFLVRGPPASELPPFELIDDRVGELVERRGKLEVPRALYGRAYVAHRYQKLLGVRHAVQLSPGRHRLHVIVRTDDLVSLHIARVHEVARGKTGVARSLVLDSPSVVFEPRRQEHARGAARTTVYWQAAPGAVVHAAFTSAPEPPSSNADAADRLLALRLERITRAVWGGGTRQRLAEGFLWYCDNRSFGETAVVIDFEHADMFEIIHGYPTIQSALASHRAHGDWYPVVVDSRRHGSLRWLPMRAGLEASPRPDPVDEAKRGADLYLVEDDCG